MTHVSLPGLLMLTQVDTFSSCNKPSFHRIWIKYKCQGLENLLRGQSDFCIDHFHKCFNPLPDDKVIDWSKLKQIADDILKCIYNEK